MSRRAYIDWLRGVAVLIMIEGHAVNAWTRPADRNTLAFGICNILNGLAAPIFLMLAGVAMMLATAGRIRRGVPARQAHAVALRRAVEIYALAFGFRLQAYLLNAGAAPIGLLKVDILNALGLSLIATSLLLFVLIGERTRIVAYGALALAVALVTPVLRRLAAAGPISPRLLAWHLVPDPQFATFPLFPWMAYVLVGAGLGILLDRVGIDPSREGRFNARLAAAGVGLMAFGWIAASQAWDPYGGYSRWWTSSPNFFLFRLGVIFVMQGGAYLWLTRPTARHYSPLVLFGRTSLFVYWVHVELIYGNWLAPGLHGALTIHQALAGYAVVTTLMFGLAQAKQTLVARWRARKAMAPATASGP